METPKGGQEPFDILPEQRMIGGIELRRAHARGKPPEQFLVEQQTGREIVRHLSI
jgi:hypothetical protein